MLRTHIRLTFRNLLKYPLFSGINLGGLAVGIAASFILLVYTQREMSCDRHFRDAHKIARVGTDFYNMGGFAKSQLMLRPLLQTSCKEVAYATSLDRSFNEIPVRINDQERSYTDIYPYYIDSSFFKVFSYEASAGQIPTEGLAPGEVILSATAARKFFGKDDPIGKTLLVGKNNKPYKVVSILKENTEKSHLDPQLLLPLTDKDRAGYPDGWNSAALYNYVKLKEGGSMAGLNTWLDRLTHTLTRSKDNATVKFMLQPLTSIYFQSDLKMELSPGGNLTQVKLLSAISIFLILLAVINYVNLVTARASTRSREIGVKKAFGASRLHLARQILLESLLFSLLAMVLACGLIQVILFLYQTSTGASLTGSIPLIAAHYGWLISFSMAVGLIAGIYPALYLTAFQPIRSIRSLTGIPGKTDPRVRNALVLVQFIIAASLVFVSFVVYGQLQYMKNKDKGFHGDGVIVVENIDRLGKSSQAFQQLINQQSSVISTSFCNRTPAGKSIWMATYRSAAMQDNMTLQTFPVDDQYIRTLGIHLTNGRNFNKNLITDTNSLIINESAAAALGLFDPVGATLNGSETVIGVVKDFNFASFREKIGPVILRYSPGGNTLTIKIRGGHTAAFLDWLQKTGKQFMPDEPLAISFLDDNFRQLSAKEELLGSAINFFTILAILLSTLGLTGLTLFTIERRRKEIGIRKVLGATLTDIMGLVSGSFIRIAAIASLIALPLSWWLVSRWLENFAYRITISIGTFFLTESVILLIAFSVIGLLTLRAVAANPVRSLRTE